jgi:glycosyltransferase involved in cell wall biosynthesis
MNILSIVHGFPPTHNAGAEWMLHDMLKYLVDKGHTCSIKSYGFPVQDINGIEAIDVLTPKRIKEADIIITHLNQTGTAINIAREYQKPLVFLSHNNHKYGIIRNRRASVYVVYNTYCMKEELRDTYGHLPSIVLHPPVDPKHYKVRKKREYITLLNLAPQKGGDIFAKITKAMPSESFLGVKGSYGTQHTDFGKNVSIWENLSDSRKAYKQTSIILMPSPYESYGRVAVEAMCSGIPVICTDTDGLREATDGKAYYIKDRTNISEWVSAIGEVKANYQRWAKMATLRSSQLETEKELSEFEAFLTDINLKHGNIYADSHKKHWTDSRVY